MHFCEYKAAIAKMQEMEMKVTKENLQILYFVRKIRQNYQTAYFVF